MAQKTERQGSCNSKLPRGSFHVPQGLTRGYSGAFEGRSRQGISPDVSGCAGSANSPEGSLGYLFLIIKIIKKIYIRQTRIRRIGDTSPSCQAVVRWLRCCAASVSARS
jgi:hypothetical protein